MTVPLCLNQFHPPPRRVSYICHFGEKMLQMPQHGGQIMQQNPHPCTGTYIDANAPPLETKYKFSEDFEPKNRTQALSRINISVFKIDCVAISFQDVLN
jgi:hypothetical protein